MTEFCKLKPVALTSNCSSGAIKSGLWLFVSVSSYFDLFLLFSKKILTGKMGLRKKEKDIYKMLIGIEIGQIEKIRRSI